ncbi:diguanylate cyclase with PAS/PAC sensor [Tolypothrix sp. NIES-4075]|uniref:histidine kinase N-terminal 7TM domain-containing diguanylate cyclase n=1 Tax=Tolypothrix sp. NIES-4075 TaxID=2005459 RepID=UPI000B5CB984|nr:histidine kinase N-terminal 7TM domain-containing protein [Tolypothrix sp. NIES-4075]GAX41396.1 diguanylate cyclase with PAS/PAC sensor [Tolypothrix sp. NIES-4075]
MLFQYNLYFIFLSLTAIISAIVAFAAWQRRETSCVSKPFILMMLAIALYATVAAMEAGAIALKDKIFWSKLEYVGSGSVITLFLIFAIHFTNEKQWLTSRNTALLWIIPAFNVAMVATNEWHNLIWTGFLLAPHKNNVVIYQHGIGFFWVMGCIYVYTFAGVLLLTKRALLPSVLYSHQSCMVLAGALIPLVGASAYMLHLTPPGLNITPMSFMLTGLISAVNIFHFRMFDLVPVARDILIDRMSDGVVVLDVQNRILDINPAAQNLIGTTAHLIGQSADQVLSKLQDNIRLYHEYECVKTEILIDSARLRYLELQITPLRDRRRQLTGHLLILRDITQRYQAEIELRQANERLRHHLLEIETLQAQLREQAMQDGLTSLFNRRYFDSSLQRELVRAAQESYPVAVILMDIDYFKKINDTFGHQAGDRVLQVFADLLRQYSRSSDIACRYGGEEFVLALPGMTLNNAYQHAEQIRLSFQAARVKFADREINTTVSGGVCVFPDNGKTNDELLQVADKALYAAKAYGRNCIKYVR